MSTVPPISTYALTPPATPPRDAKLWDPMSVLRIRNPERRNEFTCLGFTQQMNRCKWPACGQVEASRILDSLAYSPPNFMVLKNMLARLAFVGLCEQRHNYTSRLTTPDDHINWVLAQWERSMTQFTTRAQEPRARQPVPFGQGTDTPGSPEATDSAKVPVESAKEIELENEVKKLLQDVDKLRNEVDMAKATQPVLEEVSQMKDQLGVLIREKDQLIETQLKLTLDKQVREKERDQLKIDFDRVSQENENLKSQLNESDQLLCRQAQRESEQQRMQDEERQKAKQTIEEQRLVSESKLRSEQTLRDQRERGLSKAIQEAEAERNELLQRLQEQVDKNAEVQRILEQTKGQFHSLQEEQSHLQEERDQAQRELQQLHQDSSNKRSRRGKGWSVIKTRLQRLMPKRG